MMDNRPGICFFNTAKVWGGGEKWHFDHALTLHDRGFNVIAVGGVNSDLSRRFRETDIPIYEVGIRTFSFLNPRKRRRVLNIFKKNNIQTVIINLSADLKIAGPLAKRAGVKQIIYRRGSAIPVKAHFFNKYLLGSVVTGIIANSLATKRTLLQHLKLDESKITVINNGIRIRNYRALPVNNDCFTIGGLGRLNKQKAFHLLVDILRHLHDDGYKLKALIGGKGELEDDLKAYARRLQMSEYIEFPGFVEDVNVFMQQIDVFVLSSKWEGFGYVLAEAAACGKACVAFDISSNPELIMQGETGFLAKAFDTKQAADYIKHLYENKSLRNRLGENGRKYVERNFSFEKSVDRLIDYIRD
jgi:glycosyltransferase involved in cell wall biosynthesis